MDLHQEFNHAFQGQPWHGKSTMAIIEASDPQKVFVHWIVNAHSIAELVLHLTTWTEEALERLNGGVAKTPTRGDWPVILQADVQGWQNMVKDFRSAHQKLMDRIENFNSDEWDSRTVDHRDKLQQDPNSYAELINGIVQHLAYHSGQISLLQKF